MTTPLNSTTINSLPSATVLALGDELELDQAPHSINSSTKTTLQGLFSSGVVPLWLATRGVTTSTTALMSDYTIRCNATSGNVVVTLPTVSSSTGQVLAITKTDSSGNTVTFTGGTVNGFTSLATQWTKVQIQSNGTTWDVIG